jgi:transcriptional regulator with XRE-family HTH domain
MAYTKSDKSLLTAFGRRVRELRQARGISQEKLADRSGLHRTYLGGIERGERNVSLLNLQKVARALEVSLSTLMAPSDKHRLVGHKGSRGSGE